MDEPASDNRQSKRLKVGRACYTCRAKKIKCDGLRPCMQCKARKRPCSFYKDGSLEEIQEHQSSSYQPVQSPSEPQPGSEDDASLRSDDNHNDDSHFLFAEASDAKFNKLKRRGPLMESRTSNSLVSLGENLRRAASSMESSKDMIEKLKILEGGGGEQQSFGSFIMWFSEPTLPSRYSGSIEMPSKDIQMKLIDAFFDFRQETFGMLPRFYFYQQLQDKDLFITPLLLNAMYAHSSRFIHIPDCPSSNVFYHRAKRLLDDFLDMPRVSTVVALGLLALYELTPELYRPGSQHCRSWMFSGMACRMCIELGLHDDSNICKSLSVADIELRRRIFWACYELDKFQSGGWERPWIISKNFIKVKQPSPLDCESDAEKEILDHWHARIQFLFLVEDSLTTMLYNSPSPIIPLTLEKATMHQKQLSNTKDEQAAIESLSSMHMRYQQWLRSLPEKMQWTPTTNMSIQEVLELPEPRPVVLHTHLYYNTAVIEALLRLPSNNAYTQFHCRITAASLTQLAKYALDKPQFVVKFDFVAHALLCAIKVYIRHLNDADIHLAQQAWNLFDTSVKCLVKTQKYAVIPNCTKFLQQVQNTFGIDLNNKPSETTPVTSTAAAAWTKSLNKQPAPTSFNNKPTHDDNKQCQLQQQQQQTFQTFHHQHHQQQQSQLASHHQHQQHQHPHQHQPQPLQNQPQPQQDQFHYSSWRQSPTISNRPITQDHWQRPYSPSVVVLRPAESHPLLNNYMMPIQEQQQQQQQQQETDMNMMVPSQTDLYPSTNNEGDKLEGGETLWHDTSESSYTNRGLGVYLSSRQHYEDMIKHPPPQ